MNATKEMESYFRVERKRFLFTLRHIFCISSTTFTLTLSTMFPVRGNGETVALKTRRQQRDVLSSIVGAAFWITPEKRISLLSYTLTSFGMQSATSAKKRSSTLISHTPTTILSPLDSSNKLWMSYIRNSLNKSASRNLHQFDIWILYKFLFPETLLV